MAIRDPRILPGRTAVLFERCDHPGRSSSHIPTGSQIDYQWGRRDAQEVPRNARRLAEYHKRREAYARLGLA